MARRSGPHYVLIVTAGAADGDGVVAAVYTSAHITGIGAARGVRDALETMGISGGEREEQYLDAKQQLADLDDADLGNMEALLWQHDWDDGEQAYGVRVIWIELDD